MIRRAAASLPLAIVVLDVTAVAVLMPDIRLDLGSSPSGGQWVLNAYLLALAALLPLAAWLPRRPAVGAGALALAVGAVICATADSTGVLVAGRALEGAAMAGLLAGLAAPPASSLVTAALPALALAVGPLVGGVFAEQNWWHVYFWAGLPLAAATGVVALAAEPPDRERSSPALLAAFAAGLTAVTIVLVQAEPWGLSWVPLLFVFGAVVSSGVARRLPGTTVAWAALAGCLAALLFLVPEYFQLARNLSGSRSGILVLAVTLPAVTTWALSGPFAKAIPTTLLGLGGAACAAIGLAVLIGIDAHTRYAILIGALGLTGTGLGLAAGGLSRTAPPALAPALAGAALGLAIGGAAFQLEQADERSSGASFEEALAAGVGSAALFLVALLAIGTLAVWRDRSRATPASSEARPAAGS